MSTQPNRSTSLIVDEQIVEFLTENPGFFQQHPDLLSELELTHQSGGATSLIERQIMVLRGKNHHLEACLKKMITNARDNQRLAESQHRLATNLLMAQDYEDVINISLQELRERLNADFAVLRLITNEEKMLSLLPDRFISRENPLLNDFQMVLRNKRPVCGRATREQITHMFNTDAAQIQSAAIIPLVAGAELGLLALGSTDETRFQINMATDFLTQVGELVSSALVKHDFNT